MTARLVFHRAGGWMDRWRAYTLALNDTPVARIKKNSTVTKEIEPGTYVVVAQVDWCTSNELTLTVTDSAVVHIDVANPHKPWKSARVISNEPDTYLVVSLRDALPDGA